MGKKLGLRVREKIGGLGNFLFLFKFKGMLRREFLENFIFFKRELDEVTRTNHSLFNKAFSWEKQYKNKRLWNIEIISTIAKILVFKNPQIPLSISLTENGFMIRNINKNQLSGCVCNYGFLSFRLFSCRFMWSTMLIVYRRDDLAIFKRISLIIVVLQSF